MKIIDQLNAQIGPFFHATKIQAWYRQRKGGKRSQYYVNANVATHCIGQGSDGDTPQYESVYKNSTPRLSFDKSSEVNVAEVKKMICEAMGVATFAEAEAAAKAIQENSAKIMADRSAAYDLEEKTKKEAVAAATKPVSKDVAVARTEKVLATTKVSDKEKLTAFAGINKGCIMADDYRTEFLELVKHPAILDMACDMMTVANPVVVLKEYSFQFRARDQARAKGVQGKFLGSITNALTYLVESAVV